jgi:uncharacterized protein (DUF362 family)
MNVYLSKGGMPDLGFMEIHPGDWVVLKPNLIKESKETDPAEWRCVITSPEVIEAVCNHVCRELQGRGKVTICDAPQTDSSFARIAELLDLAGIARRCSAAHGVPVEVIDLRGEEWRNEAGIIVDRRKLPGDPNGLVRFNLGRDSLFFGFAGEGRYYGADYDAGVVNSHHHGDTQEYLICATPIKCDVFINLPKMKTHKKTGVTLNLKNLVGINADKNWLPHHTVGSPQDGGDQFPSASLKNRIEHHAAAAVRRLALALPGVGPALAKRMRQAGTAAFGSGQRTIRSGNWHGNDTTWRMVLDLNRCLLYGNPDGSLRRGQPKRYYCVIDGLVGMQGAGPMQGDPIESGLVVAGSDPVAVDIVAARAMGFDWRKLKILREAAALRSLPPAAGTPADINVVSNVPAWNGPFATVENADFLHFQPHFGWLGQIEYHSGR